VVAAEVGLMVDCGSVYVLDPDDATGEWESSGSDTVEYLPSIEGDLTVTATASENASGDLVIESRVVPSGVWEYTGSYDPVDNYEVNLTPSGASSIVSELEDLNTVADVVFGRSVSTDIPDVLQSARTLGEGNNVIGFRVSDTYDLPTVTVPVAPPDADINTPEGLPIPVPRVGELVGSPPDYADSDLPPVQLEVSGETTLVPDIFPDTPTDQVSFTLDVPAGVFIEEKVVDVDLCNPLDSLSLNGVAASLDGGFSLSETAVTPSATVVSECNYLPGFVLDVRVLADGSELASETFNGSSSTDKTSRSLSELLSGGISVGAITESDLPVESLAVEFTLSDVNGEVIETQEASVDLPCSPKEALGFSGGFSLNLADNPLKRGFDWQPSFPSVTHDAEKCPSSVLTPDVEFVVNYTDAVNDVTTGSVTTSLNDTVSISDTVSEPSVNIFSEGPSTVTGFIRLNYGGELVAELSENVEINPEIKRPDLSINPLPDGIQELLPPSGELAAEARLENTGDAVADASVYFDDHLVSTVKIVVSRTSRSAQATHTGTALRLQPPRPSPSRTSRPACPT